MTERGGRSRHVFIQRFGGRLDGAVYEVVARFVRCVPPQPTWRLHDAYLATADGDIFAQRVPDKDVDRRLAAARTEGLT